MLACFSFFALSRVLFSPLLFPTGPLCSLVIAPLLVSPRHSHPTVSEMYTAREALLSKTIAWERNNETRRAEQAEIEAKRGTGWHLSGEKIFDEILRRERQVETARERVRRAKAKARAKGARTGEKQERGDEKEVREGDWVEAEGQASGHTHEHDEVSTKKGKKTKKKMKMMKKNGKKKKKSKEKRPHAPKPPSEDGGSREEEEKEEEQAKKGAEEREQQQQQVGEEQEEHPPPPTPSGKAVISACVRAEAARDAVAQASALAEAVHALRLHWSETKDEHARLCGEIEELSNRLDDEEKRMRKGRKAPWRSQGRASRG